VEFKLNSIRRFAVLVADPTGIFKNSVAAAQRRLTVKSGRWISSSRNRHHFAIQL